jgi:hypothetical protein
MKLEINKKYISKENRELVFVVLQGGIICGV